VNAQPIACPFCSLPDDRIVDSHPLAVVVADAYPVATGHTLVIPRRHVGSFFELDAHEQAAMLELLGRAHQRLQRELGPDGYTVGINDGPAAGQTVPHVHLHLIPRRVGDVSDPHGGVRWVLPHKARYWS
jgi:diadenosine tetraphosphate (Ap4A) HIT family hydrolase